MEMLELAAELKWCRERIAAYEVEREQMQQYYRRAIADRDNANAAISRLREYANHRSNCSFHLWDSDAMTFMPCDCGYDELMKELEESK